LETYILKCPSDQIYSSKFVHTSLVIFNVLNVSKIEHDMLGT